MSAASDAARAWSREQSDQFQAELFEMLRIPSLSGDPAFAGDIGRMADWLADHMKELGLDHVAVMETAGHPVVYAEWLGAGDDALTLLVYGHYDVVPAVMEDGWDADPFEPVVKDGKVFARGATDDKGQLHIHIKALQSWLATHGKAPVNVKILLEGEEEVSSPNLAPFIKEHLDVLKADVCVISDSSMVRIEEPAITHSLRGMTYIEIDVQGPREDLHSGFFGGATHNPALALVEIIEQLFDENNSIAVPGFYDDVVPLSDDDRKMIAKTDITAEEFMASTGSPGVWGVEEFTIKERVSARPTLEINGMWSGYTGPGPKTIIPQSAGAKISCRLVGDQDPEKIWELLRDYIESIAPPTVKVAVSLLSTGRPALFAADLPAMKAAVRAYERGWGHTPVFTRGGGSIPIVADIADMMGIPVVMMGYGLDSDGLHAPNEHYSLEMFARGIETAIVYLEELSEITG